MRRGATESTRRWVLVAVVALGSEPLSAQAPPSVDNTRRPDAARRTVRVIDFEEKAINPHPVPMFSVRAQDGWIEESAQGPVPHPRPGFPDWNKAELDYATPAFSGAGSVRLPTAGGSTSLLFQPTLIPIFQNADYRVSCQVRTRGLVHARARVIARVLDASRQPVAGGEHASDLVVAEQDWASVEVGVEGKFPGAAYLSLELALLQPEQFSESRPGSVTPQDLEGSAWFDDLIVTQVPRIRLTTSAPGNVYAAGESPEIRLEIRDLTGEALTADLRVTDDHGREVDRATRSVSTGHATPWRPKAPPAGWYRATLSVRTDSKEVGRASVDFIRLGEPRSPDAARLGLIVEEIGPETLAILPAVVRRLGVGSISLPVVTGSLRRDAMLDTLRAEAPSIDALLNDGVEVTLRVARLPDELSDRRRVDPDALWPVVSGDPTDLGPYLDPYFEKYGQRVRRWGIGQPRDDQAFWRPGIADELRGAARNFGRLVPGPTVAVPWRVTEGVGRSLAIGAVGQTLLDVLVPHDAAPASILGFAERWRHEFEGTDFPELRVVLEPPPPDEFGHAVGPAEIVKKTVAFWQALGPGTLGAGQQASLALADPWAEAPGRQHAVWPTPELAAWANLSQRLAGRRVVGEFPVAAGVTCLILAPIADVDAVGATGALVAWNQSADPADAVLRGHLGAGPIRVVDLYGNAHPAPMDPANATHTRPAEVAIPLGPLPVFVEGIDAMLVRFLASVRVEPGLITATNTAHEHAIVFENPWNTGLDIRGVVVQPGGVEAGRSAKDRAWRITPRSGHTVVAPGQTGRLPISVAFSPAEESGPKDFVLDLEIIADKPHGVVRVTRHVTLGLDHVSVEITARVQTNGDVVIEAQVANTGVASIDLELTAFAPGQPRAKTQVSRLGPGRIAVRRFPYSAPSGLVAGQRVTVAVTEPETKARLNKVAVIE